jgi:signal peptidase II
VLWRAARGAPMGGTSLLALAAGGAAGNIWDRISRAAEGPLSGEVVDFLAVDGFAIFNVADIFTTCGVAGWALLQVIRKGDAPTPAQSNT